MKKIAVIGDGGWGTALSLVLQRNGHDVTVWGAFAEHVAEVKAKAENKKYLPGVSLPSELRWTADREQAVCDADMIVIAVPSKFYRSVVESFKPYVPASAWVVSVTKGLDKETNQRMSVTAQSLWPSPHVAALSGPSHAEEVARGAPTAVVVACADMDTAAHIQALFNNALFRVYTSDDVIGVELGGALKNVIAIAAGVCDGIGYGDNSKAALMTRGLTELKRLGEALGANPATFSGLSGIGDLIVTCTSRLSRNRGVGERLGKGETLQDILNSMEQVAEGVWNCANALALAGEVNVELPITEEVNAVVHEGKNPKDAVTALLERDPKPERDELN
jgi:glycerol-3-phosphate dehydrogenase (NAD(P)+)